MSAFRAKGFGRVRLLSAADDTEIPLQPTPRRLLGFFILVSGTAHHREAVAEALWPERDPDSARRCLNSTVHRLNHAAAEAVAHSGPLVVSRSTDDMALDRTVLGDIDISRFEALVAEEKNTGEEYLLSRVDTLEKANALYTGPLMDGIADEWAVRARSNAEATALSVKKRLMECYLRLNAPGSAIRYGREILEIDALHEETHRDLMAALYANGQRVQALNQFDKLRALLAHELAIPPMPETQALCAQIRLGTQEADGEDAKVPLSALRKRLQENREAPAAPADLSACIQDMRDRIRDLRSVSRRVVEEADEMESMLSDVLKSIPPNA